MIEMAVKIAEIFGKNLRRIRKEKGYTQTKLCQDLKISVPAIVSWEKGEGIPGEKGKIDQIAEYLQTPAQAFFLDPTDSSPQEAKKLRITPKQAVEVVNELAAKGELVIKWKPN